MNTMPKMKTFAAATNNDVNLAMEADNFIDMISALNQNLAHAVDLRSRTKQMHWNAKGGGFYFMHKMFDKFTSELDSIASELGERVMVLGGQPAGTVTAVAKLSKLPPHSLEAANARVHIEGLIAAYDVANEHCVSALKLAIKADHHVSAAILTGFARLLDEQRAILAAHAEPVTVLKPKRFAA